MRRPMIERFKDTNSNWRFRVKATNHEIVAQSQQYKSLQGCDKGIRSLRRAMLWGKVTFASPLVEEEQ